MGLWQQELGRESELGRKKENSVLEETQENWLLPRGWSCDSLEEQNPKGVSEPGLDQAVLGHRRAKAGTGSKASWHETVVIGVCDAGSCVREVAEY